MNAYHAFALVYDRMMEEIPYEEWCNFVTDQLKKFGIEDGLMLELGCGTGTLTEVFDAKGFDMIGVDNSEEMLAEAVEKREQSGRQRRTARSDPSLQLHLCCTERAGL